MYLDGISHKCGFADCYSLNDEEVVIKLTTNKSVSAVNIVCEDPYVGGCMGASPWHGSPVPMEVTKELARSLVWEIVLKPRYKRIQYYFEIKSGDESVLLLEDGIHDVQVLNIKGYLFSYFKFGWMNSVDINRHPSWVENTFWYQIMPDRFCRVSDVKDPKFREWSDISNVTCDTLFGGNLEGVISKLEYIRSLGITGIYFTPFLHSSSSHKYNIKDYRNVDPDFGDNKTFKKLVDKAHSLGLKVIIDAVFNHSSREFFAWQDVLKNGKNSKYFDWYFINQDDFSGDAGTEDGRYYTFAFVTEMPKLNTNNPEVMEYFTNICKEWIDLWNIDGIRFDVGNEISHAFLKKLNKELKAYRKDLFLLGEIWTDSSSYMLGDEYDSVMNYPFLYALNNFFANKAYTAHDFKHMINYCYSMYQRQSNSVLFNFVDSHDIDRVCSRFKKYDIYIQQLTMLVTMPGSPCMYYGTEIAMEGEGDSNRNPMPWDDISRGEYDDKINIVRKLIALRNEHQAFRSEDIVWTEGDNRFISYIRKSGDEEIIVLLNATDESKSVSVSKDRILFDYRLQGDCLEAGGVLIVKK